MDPRPFVLLLGDPYRCGRALEERDAEIRNVDPARERIARFADETDVASLDMELQSAPLFAMGRHFVIRGVDKARKAKPWADLAGRTLPAATFATWVAAELSASHAVRKVCETHGVVVALPPPASRGAAGAASEVLAAAGVKLPPADVAEIVRRTGGDLLAISREAAKLRSFAETAALDRRAVEALVFPAAEPTAYPFFDLLGERDLAGALRALADLRDDAGRLLGGGVRHVTRLTMLRALLDARVPPDEMAEAVGVQDWLLRRLLSQARRFSTNEAAAVLEAGVELDADVKSGGRTAPDALLEFVFAATRRPSARARG